MPGHSITSILQTESNASAQDSELFSGIRPSESMLAGQYLGEVTTTRELVTRRRFLQSAGAALLTTPFMGNGNRRSTRSILPFEGPDNNENETQVAIAGQFTPYASYTMGVNLCNRLGMESYDVLLSEKGRFAEFLLALRESKDSGSLVSSLNNLHVLQRADVFEAAAQRIEEAKVLSVADSGKFIGIKDVLRSAMDTELETPEVLVAPQVLRFDPSRPKLSYIFTKAHLKPLEKWDLVDGKPALMTLNPDSTVTHDALIVDCLAGSNMGFYSDLLQGAERHLGYHWEQGRGFYMLDENGDPSANKINRLPMTQLSYDVD